MSNKYYGDDDLLTNTQARIPVCLLVDVSGSMSSLLPEVNAGIADFYEAIVGDDTAVDKVECAIVDFSDDARLIKDFSTLSGQSPATVGPVRGCTDLAAGINMALDLLEARKKEYQDNHVDYYQPQLVIFSDGAPTSPYETAKSRVLSLTSNRKLNIIPIVLGGSDEACGVLREFGKTPVRAKDIVGFFAWYSKSLSAIGKSNPGDKVKVDVDGIADWGEW